MTSECRNSSLTVCEHWLKSWLRPPVNDPFFTSLVSFVTCDEGPDSDTSGFWGLPGGGRVYLTAVSPFAGKVHVSYQD